MTTDTSSPSTGMTGENRVLIVEDEAISRLLLELTLSDAGLEVRSASTREEALSLAREFQPSLLLTDISLADGSGMELVREIRAFLDIRAVALTGREREDMSPDGSSDGFDGWLTKPADMEQVCELALKLLKTK